MPYPKHLFTLEVTLSTPLLIGWYKPEIADPLGLRTAEIKGIWRWWVRAFICGVLYDNGFITGIHTNDILLKPRREEVSIISKLVGKLGLGYSIGGESEASRFILRIRTENGIRISSYKKRSDKLYRIKLLTLNKSIEYIPENTRFYIEVWKRYEKRDRNINLAEELALKILIIALQLNGFGKGGRRGLGSLDIISYKKVVIPINNVISKSLRDQLKEIYKGLTELIEEDKEIRKISRTRSEDYQIPPMPCISKRVYRDGKKELPITRIFTVSNVSFTQIHNFFLRSMRAKVTNPKNPHYMDLLRNNYNAWILGLPRSAGMKTGYLIPSEVNVERRASPLIVSYHKNNGVLGLRSGATFSLFISGDWPCKLKWRGGGGSTWQIDIDKSRLLKAYHDLYCVLDRYIVNINGRRLDIWP